MTDQIIFSGGARSGKSYRMKQVATMLKSLGYNVIVISHRKHTIDVEDMSPIHMASILSMKELKLLYLNKLK